VTWPIGRGPSFAGTLDLARNLVRRLDADEEGFPVSGPDDPKCIGLLPEHERDAWLEEVTLAQEGLARFQLEPFREGHLTPVFFGSALKNFGVRDLINSLAEIAPSPRGQNADKRLVTPAEPGMTGFVFKIQANMDPNHRDRIAFMRVCSGRLERGMKAKLVRTGKPISLSSPQFFFAQDRAIADEAFAGDVVGIPNHGTLAHRRHADGGRGPRLQRRPVLRAGDHAAHQALGPHEGEEAARGAAADGRGRRRAALPARRRLARRSSASSARSSSTS
jgi:peptide chain release factor 3